MYSLLCTSNFFIYIITSGQSKNISKPLFCLIRSSTKIIEFDHVKLPASISFNDAFEENFLRLTVTVCFQNNEYFKNVHFLTLFSVNKL